MGMKRSPGTSSKWLAPIALALLAGCGGGDDGGAGGSGGSAPAFEYPLDDVLRLNQLQVKGTHNSYHVANPDLGVPELMYTHAPLDEQLRAQGVRQFELDTHFSYVKNEFEVYHLGSIDEGTTCRRFVDCLGAMKAWSDDNPAHHPIFVQIEPKDEPAESQAEGYFADLEGEILGVWPRDRVLTPDDVRGSAATLRDALAAGGWPTLGEARGKILFFVDNATSFRSFYTHGDHDLDGRLMFIDADPEDPWAGVLLANDPVGDADRIAASVAGNLLVRTRADSDNEEPLAGDTTRRDTALASGAQFVSTDYPIPVDGVEYVVEIPGGTPSRCNPLTAPAECVPQAIEDPKYIH